MRTVAHVPFKHLEACPKCGRVELKVVHNQKYPEQDGIHQLVVYRCPNGHETPRRQLVVQQEGVPPKKDWGGWH